MGTAIARGLSAPPLLYSRSPESAQKVGRGDVAASLKALVEGADLLLLAVLPSNFDQIAEALRPLVGPHHTIVSILSGMSVERLREAIEPAGRHLQMMPNLGVEVGKGVIAVEEEGVQDEKERQEIEQLFSPLGHIVFAPHDKMRAISVISGSSPAFFALYLEAMVDSAVWMGLSAPEALELLLKTVEGAIALMGDPKELRQRVAAPGGTTIEGIRAFEMGGGRSAIIEMALAAYHRVHK